MGWVIMVDLHLTNLPDDIVKMLKIHKARSGISISQAVTEIIYDSKWFDTQIANTFFKEKLYLQEAVSK